MPHFEILFVQESNFMNINDVSKYIFLKTTYMSGDNVCSKLSWGLHPSSYTHSHPTTPPPPHHHHHHPHTLLAPMGESARCEQDVTDLMMCQNYSGGQLRPMFKCYRLRVLGPLDPSARRALNMLLQKILLIAMWFVVMMVMMMITMILSLNYDNDDDHDDHDSWWCCPTMWFVATKSDV